MKWVTWENVGVDRMACAWLIRRWIDAEASFSYIPPGTAALPDGAEPFDIPAVKFSHHRGHCSFYAFIKHYKMSDPALKRMAQIVDEADVVQEVSLEPAAPGLDLLCRGLRRISRDDDEAMRRGYLLYDALYAELTAQQGVSTIPSLP
jgi:hypothetical protein